ncbi:MAG: 6,7-dimethyl-8-ribityllumazine synthase [Alphaproteobacteria bacterium]|nr:6,7-dimethyl-8-ribityllumazine synthase [Alphaproteobacteria bacterium]
MAEKKPHIRIIEARFFKGISDELMKGALIVLNAMGASFERFEVPGALEIPAAIAYGIKMKQYAPARRRFDGFIALGCVIKGDTYHFEVVANESSRALSDLATNYTLALGNGILTTYTEDQAWHRASITGDNKGGAAAQACLDMIALKGKLGLYPRE